MIIKIILVSVLMLVFVGFYSSRLKRHSGALSKLLFILFFFSSLVAVITPEITNKIANMLGVGRGADLLTYLLAVALIVHIAKTHLELKEQETRIIKLSRKIALEGSEEINKRK